MTKYLILREVKGSRDWAVFGFAEATSAEGAVRKAIAGNEDVDGTFVAVPERSWQPVDVEVQVKARVVLTATGGQTEMVEVE